MIQILDTSNILHYDQAMTTFEIYLNRHPDLFRRFGPTEGGFQIGDPLELAFTGKVLTDESENALLNKIFEIFNIDHPEGYAERSLSVGDVVVINGRSFACQPFGWTRLVDLEAVKAALDPSYGDKEYEAELLAFEERELAEEAFGYHGAGREYYDDFDHGLGEIDCGGA